MWFKEIAVSYREDVVDLIAWAWGSPVKDHGVIYCKECKENGGTDLFATYSDFYLDHLGHLINTLKTACKHGLYLELHESWSAAYSHEHYELRRKKKRR